MANPRSVLILRPDNLGDVVLFSGALCHIRAIYPQAKITLCVKRYVHNLVELCPHVDRIVYWEDLLHDLYHDPLAHLRHSPLVRRANLRELGRELIFRLKYRVDIVLLPVRSPRPLLHDVVRSIPAHWRYGIAGDRTNQTAEEDAAAEPNYAGRLQVEPDWRKGPHELEVTRRFLSFLGIEGDDLWPEFWTHQSDQAWALEAIPARAGVTTLAICPGVISLAGKYYPGARYAQALALLKDRQYAVFMFGSAADKAMCEEVARAVQHCPNVTSIADLTAQTTIRQLVEGLRRCDMILSQETAPLHMGVALRKPTVGIMGGGHHGRFYPWGDLDLNREANVSMNCYGCNWRCHYTTVRCVQEIPPDIIADEIRQAWQYACEASLGREAN